MKRLTDLEKINLTDRWKTGDYSIKELSSMYNITATAIRALLKRRGCQMLSKSESQKRRFTSNSKVERNESKKPKRSTREERELRYKKLAELDERLALDKIQFTDMMLPNQSMWPLVPEKLSSKNRMLIFRNEEILFTVLEVIRTHTDFKIKVFKDHSPK